MRFNGLHPDLLLALQVRPEERHVTRAARRSMLSVRNGRAWMRSDGCTGMGELQKLIDEIASRVGRVLERRGQVERDTQNA